MATEFYIGSKMKKVFHKDPDDNLFYTWNWTAWLLTDTDTILSVEIIPATGITAGTPIIVGGRVKVLLGGGTAGLKYEVVCRITTTLGQRKDATIILDINPE